MKLSKTYENFDAESESIVTYIGVPANATRLKVIADQVTEGQEYRSTWETIYGKYRDPVEHNTPVVTDMKLLYKDFKKWTRDLKKGIKNNPTVVLTGDDYAALYIHQDAPRRKAIPRPTINPANVVMSQSYCKLQIFTSNPNPPYENDTKLPVDVSKIGRKFAITLKDEREPDLSAFQTLENIGSTIWDLTYEAEKIGMRGWLITYYINARGQEGPNSRTLDFVLS